MYLEKNMIQKDTCTPVFIAALFTVAKTWKQPECPSTEEWIKKWYIYTMEYYSAIKKKEIMPFSATWLNLEIVQWSESDREGEISYDIPDMQTLKRNDSNELFIVKQKQTHRFREGICSSQGKRSEKGMAPHSSTLAWKIPWTEEPDRLQSMGLLRVGHHWATSLSLFTFMHWRRKWQPTPVFLPGESQGQRSLVGCRLWSCTESDTTEAT